MRPDAKALLSRLGQRDFQYRQFADPIADVEPWPLFAALLEDERVVGRAERAKEERASAANFLSDYDDMSGRGDPSQRQGGSLRAFLSGLSDDSTERR
ncbi:hypothetical protein NHF48_022590 [Sphingomonas sp. H160509]|jgi:hypothetical protein|uniref:hypothetical protein n=1 Tax=Sphingomonas sp. H160509 TaxID=2955313 RepID=UPI0010EF4008|nr:hypothetical protein [Sphingomonas sp. H160509]MDD1453082.1 hypothetical protein [Sphingomonas sp. H160509]RYD27817.1 MAG: hypothetical protein EOP89_03925 [Xanthomonadaceae bacterium]